MLCQLLHRHTVAMLGLALLLKHTDRGRAIYQTEQSMAFSEEPTTRWWHTDLKTTWCISFLQYVAKRT